MKTIKVYYDSDKRNWNEKIKERLAELGFSSTEVRVLAVPMDSKFTRRYDIP